MHPIRFRSGTSPVSESDMKLIRYRVNRAIHTGNGNLISQHFISVVVVLKDIKEDFVQGFISLKNITLGDTDKNKVEVDNIYFIEFIYISICCLNHTPFLSFLI